MKNILRGTLAASLLALALSACQRTPKLITEADEIVRFEVLSCADTVLNRAQLEAEGVRYGVEGGRVVKEGGTYHMITAEMVGDPYCVDMKLGYWTSPDGLSWMRVRTIAESDGDFTGASQRSSVWGPMPVFQEKDNRWHLFYTCYKGKPNEPNIMHSNFHGAIMHAISDVEGRGGIGGPYTDQDYIIYGDHGTDAWEGYQAVDSFFPYPVGKKWYGFYGSATTQDLANCTWDIGLAEADRLEGPWKRMSERNPVPVGDFAENPIVYQLDNGVYIAIVDGGPFVNKMGYTLSWNGLDWSNLRYFELEPTVAKWWSATRTPMCLIEEADGTYTMFFTAFKDDDPGRYGALSKLSMKLSFID